MISSRKHRYLKSFSDLRPGDVLTVRSKGWYEQNHREIERGIFGVYVGSDQGVFIEDMVRYCGHQLKVKRLLSKYNNVIRNVIFMEGTGFKFSTWMFEEFEFPNIDSAL